jgi:hypothetical protein
VRVRRVVEWGDLARALMEWARLKSRIKLLAYDIKTGYDKDMNKHLLVAQIVIACETARDCKKVEEGLDYLFENFEQLKDKPLSLLKTR